MNLQRVSKKEPCAACGKDSWCLFSETDALCMRLQSESPFIFSNGDQGWWHRSGLPRPAYKPSTKVEAPRIDALGMCTAWHNETTSSEREELAHSLGVSVGSIARMCACWAPEHQAWAWPMEDGNGRVCGIRLRSESGKKWCVTGSQQGVFVPAAEPAKRVWLVEGPTDTAAMLTAGVYAIGRPSNSGGLLAIKQTIRRLRIQEVVIVADNDMDMVSPKGRKFNPGYDGARSLQNHIGISSCIVALPTKDAREFVKESGTKEMLDYIAAQAVWENPT